MNFNWIKKIIKKMLLGIGILISVLVLVVFLFINLSPEFGGKATEQEKECYAKSDNYKEGKFINRGNINLSMSAGDMLKAIGGIFKSIPNSRPQKNIEVQKIDSSNIAEYTSTTRFVWFGHSAFLVQMNNKNILIDPMLGNVPAPSPLLMGNRFSKELPIEIEKLPKIDAVLITHDHYDHLDYGSILKLKSKVDTFYTPLGVGVHLQKWGIEKERIIELDWWQETTFGELVFRCTPAQHFSGRGFSDREKTLWCSWIIQSKTENIFFSGDSGYAPHFKEIGDKYGPFDFAMMECGQYNELWSDIHMFPEETAQAALDIQTKSMMPIHWGAFKLAQHDWTEPIKRVSKKAEELNIKLVTPQIGEPFVLGNSDIAFQKWWDN